MDRIILLLLCVCVVLDCGFGRKHGRFPKRLLVNQKVTSGQDWVQSICHTNFHGNCSDKLVSQLLEDYSENEALLQSIPEPYEIIYPIQIRRNAKVQLSTLDHRIRHTHSHLQHVTLQLTLGGKKQKVKLQLNHEMFLNRLIQKHYLPDKTQVITEQSVQHCYYHGNLKKLENSSSVAMSTCNGGLHGIIQSENETYIIQPLRITEEQLSEMNETRHPHVVYKARKPPTASAHSSCGNSNYGLWTPFQDLAAHRAEYLRHLKIMKARRVERDLLSETKYLELALVMDYHMFEKWNSSYSSVVSYAIRLANILDMYFKELNIRIALTYVEVWNQGHRMYVSRNARETLQNFVTYSYNSLKNVKYDVAQFITGQRFSGSETGMAIPESVCTQRALGVNQDLDINEPEQVVSTLGHMIGHNIGLKHDETRNCTCSDWYGCIMSETVLGVKGHHPRHFSSCSRTDLNASLNIGLTSCLFNRPTELAFPQSCGNGHVERGEECDCGAPEECARNDPCCDPETCMLRPWANCRTGPCCRNCTVLHSGHICRDTVTVCDVPEYCDGVTGRCPDNVYIQDGTSCLANDGTCYKGVCHSQNQQCGKIWGKEAKAGDHRCYTRFNPTGNFNGNCGRDESTGEYLKCEDEDVMCGLLQCAEGDKEPLQGADKTYSKTTVVSDGIEFECKILNSPLAPDLTTMGMVDEGTKCGQGKMCVNQACRDIHQLVTGKCPLGINNLTCSGNGVCTNEVKCFCEYEFEGSDCSRNRNMSLVPTTTTPKPTTTWPWRRIITMTTMTSTTTTNATAIVGLAAEENRVSTMWLIIILASVIGSLFVILGFTMLCYRRKSPTKLGPYATKKNKLMFANKGLKLKKRPASESSEDTNINRIISFGSMPSYRHEKKKLSQGGKKTSSESEGDNHSGTEVKIPVLTEQLSKQPERGILKNSLNRKSTDSLQAALRNMPAQVTVVREKESSPIKEEDMDSYYSGSGSDTESEKGAERGSQHSSKHSQSPHGSKEELDSPTRARLLRLKNIDDLIQQIDQQFMKLSPANSMCDEDRRHTESAAGSEDIGCSETEADRYYQRGSFIRQSDLEQMDSSPDLPSPPEFIPDGAGDCPQSPLSDFQFTNSKLYADVPFSTSLDTFHIDPSNYEFEPIKRPYTDLDAAILASQRTPSRHASSASVEVSLNPREALREHSPLKDLSPLDNYRPYRYSSSRESSPIKDLPPFQDLPFKDLPPARELSPTKDSVSSKGSRASRDFKPLSPLKDLSPLSDLKDLSPMSDFKDLSPLSPLSFKDYTSSREPSPFKHFKELYYPKEKPTRGSIIVREIPLKDENVIRRDSYSKATSGSVESVKM